jgi:hypothetical protein
VAISTPYVRPYLDSAVFISWLKDADMGRLADGTTADRHPISSRILQDAQDNMYQVVTSYFTIAEVYKKRLFVDLNARDLVVPCQ